MTAKRLALVAVIVIAVGTVAGSAAGAGLAPSSSQVSKPVGKPVAVLDGVYRLDVDLNRQLRNGTAQAGKPFSLHYAFRSTCDGVKCVAVGRLLKDGDLKNPADGRVAIMDFVNGEWVRTNAGKAACGAEEVPALQSWSLKPGGDGTLTGIRRLAFFGVDCDGAYEQPMSAARIGDVDPGLSMPDPAQEPALKAAAAEGFHGRYIMSRSGRDGGTAPDVQVDVTTRCIRNVDDCLTYATLQPPAGGTSSVRAYQFQGKTWTAESNAMAKCPNGRDATVATHSTWDLPDPVADPFLRVTGTQSDVYLLPCAKTVDFVVLMIRIGD